MKPAKRVKIGDRNFIWGRAIEGDLHRDGRTWWKIAEFTYEGIFYEVLENLGNAASSIY